MRCRSLARYMVCNMTENTQLLENSVLERLNAGTTVREFLRAAITLLAEAVAILVTQVFRKDDYAVKYAVEPLLVGAGPLAELSVRLKLVYALGVISRQEYEDAELLMALHEELQQDPGDYRFTDDEIMGPFGELHCVAAFPPSPQIAHGREMKRWRRCNGSATSKWCARRWSSPPPNIWCGSAPKKRSPIGCC